MWWYITKTKRERIWFLVFSKFFELLGEAALHLRVLVVLPRRHESCCQQHITLLNIQMPHSCSCCVVAYLSYEVFSPLCQAFNCRINLTGSAGLLWLIYLTWLTVTAYRGSCMKWLIVKHTVSFLSQDFTVCLIIPEVCKSLPDDPLLDPGL